MREHRPASHIHVNLTASHGMAAKEVVSPEIALEAVTYSREALEFSDQNAIVADMRVGAITDGSR
jgi:hypothetical protein